MKLLRAMREPLKYVQGKGALLKFKEEMGYMGQRWLFICSKSGYKACHDQVEQSFGDGPEYRRWEVFGGISSKGEIEKMKQIVAEDKIDAVVACGGGSAATARRTAAASPSARSCSSCSRGLRRRSSRTSRASAWRSACR